MPYLLISLNNSRPSVNFRKLILVGIEFSRFFKREQERKAQYVFLIFLRFMSFANQIGEYKTIMKTVVSAIGQNALRCRLPA